MPILSSDLTHLWHKSAFQNLLCSIPVRLSTIIRTFDIVSYPKPKLTKVLSIDEFKGNTWGEKYQCILADPENKAVLDILPKRYAHYLSGYFKSIPKVERQEVEYFISDMWKTYMDTASVWFKGAIQIVDKYHWIRQVIWAFENVRKQEQKAFMKDYRIYFKHSKKLLLKRFSELTDEQKQQVNIMLYASVNISRAHYFKESFLEILECANRETAKVAMQEWISDAENSELPQFEKCAKTMRNWLSGILNSFSAPYTNGFTEGCNNKIKVLKRNAYGYKNFKRFEIAFYICFLINLTIQKR